MVTTVDRGRWGCVLDGDADRRIVAMRARELGRTPIVVGDQVDVGHRVAIGATVEDQTPVLRRADLPRAREVEVDEVVADGGGVNDGVHRAREHDGKHRERRGERHPDRAGAGDAEAAHVVGLAVGEVAEALHRLQRQGGQRGVAGRHDPLERGDHVFRGDGPAAGEGGGRVEGELEDRREGGVRPAGGQAGPRDPLGIDDGEAVVEEAQRHEVARRRERGLGGIDDQRSADAQADRVRVDGRNAVGGIGIVGIVVAADARRRQHGERHQGG